MNTLSTLKAFSDSLEKTESIMPLLFMGHGSPMNGIEQNEFSESWTKMGDEIPLPKAVICISAHWLTKGTFVTAMEKPKTIHDFGGFPTALFEVQYPAPGNSELAYETKSLITKTNVGLSHDWGLDHGTWSVVKNMYPLANIPVLQLSIDYYQPPQYHYELAKELAILRRKGVLIIGSGNMVHNLRMIQFNQNQSNFGFDWAIEMNEIFKKHILTNNHQPLLDFPNLGTAAQLAIPTPDHYYPLLYILGMQEKNEEAQIFNDKAVMGSITMTSVKIG
ncbi:MAG: 4,5-DOPA dioxygenase extradiol [Bacteroidota bacterium]